MHLADHIRPLLRDHDCVIIPDFGGLVANVSPARAQPGRQALSPPTKLVAFNQALTRNDGLLVDALSQRTGLPIAEAREAVRRAVASLQRELDETNRTELPGIGVFRRAAGRGLAFEYTGSDNLLAAAFGLPELAARPVRAHDARPSRPQPALRGAGARRTRWARVLPGSIMALAVGLVLLANYQFAAQAGYLPAGWRTQLPQWEWASHGPTSTPTIGEPQQAALGQHDFSSRPALPEGMTPLAEAASEPAAAATPALVVAPVAAETPATATPAPVAIAAAKPAPVAVEPAAPAATTSAKTDVPAAAVVKAAPARVKEPVETGSSTIIKSRTGRFYVIAGAYTTLAGAEIGRKTLAHSGHPARIILPFYGTRFFRVTAADYSDLAAAQREAQRLRISTKADYNTLKF